MQDGPSVEYNDRQTSPDNPKRSTAIRFMNESDRMFGKRNVLVCYGANHD